MKSYTCEVCGKKTKVAHGMKTLGRCLCQRCNIYFKEGGTIHELPRHGEVVLDERGYPICHICGRAYRKLIAHTRQAHGMQEREYKEKFELAAGKGILYEGTRTAHREAVIRRFDTEIAINLLEKGKDTRFKLNGKGRTKDQIRLQTKIEHKRRTQNV